jgi:DNA-binding MarR family transcriptional regulator
MSLAAAKQGVLQECQRSLGVLPEAVCPLYDLIELMFFAYRDFSGDADRTLTGLGFGRAHHRLLHFVARRPGLTTAELLDILRVSKQSLIRVLNVMVDRNYIEVRPGIKDRRQRQLYPTSRGAALAREVALLQSKRFARVFGSLPEGAQPHAQAFLLAMVDLGRQDKIAAMTSLDGALCSEGSQS